MSSLPTIEVFLRADPLEAVVISDPPVEVNQPIFQTVNPSGFATAEQGELAETALQPEAIADFETTAQLNARDTANRNRTNHSGTQEIGTISGLQDALNGKASAAQGAKADSALQSGANISLLTNNAGYLSAIPNGAIIGDVAHFVQPTNPSSRIVNGVSSPLVTGDRNYRSDLRLDTHWNGTYWLSPPFTVGQSLGFSSITSTNNNLLYAYLPTSTNLFLRSFGISTVRESGNYDNSNTWTIELSGRNGVVSGTAISFHSIPGFTGLNVTQGRDFEISVNNLLLKGSGTIPTTLFVRATKTGNPPNIFTFAWWAIVHSIVI